MPITPDVARPIGRSVSSSALNRIDWACLLTSSRSSSGEISAASISSSSSPQVDRHDAAGAVGVEIGQLGLLDQAGLGGQHQVRRDLVVLDRHHLGDRARPAGRPAGWPRAGRGRCGWPRAGRRSWCGRPGPCW